MAALDLPYWTASVVGALAYAAVAALLVYLTPRTAATRVFAGVLVLRGIIGVTATVSEQGHYATAAVVLHLEALLVHLFIAMVLSFSLLYPRRRPWAAPVIGVLLVVAAVVMTLAALNPDLVGRAAVTDTGRLALVDAGPLFAGALGMTSLVWAAIIIAWEYVRGRAGASRGSVLLVVIGLASYPAFIFPGVTLAADPNNVGPFLPPWWLLVLGTASVAVLPLLLAGHAMVTNDPADRRASAAAAAVLAACSAMAVLLWVAPDLPLPLRALFRFPLPILVTYALLRHSLFDVDIKMKWTIRRGTVAGIFVAVFFVVSELTQQFLTDEFGYVTGGLAAGALLFAIVPLQRVAERVADAALPGVAEPRRGGGEADEEAYRDAVRMALADGVISRQEERALQRLAERLTIGVDRAWGLREEIEGEMGTPPDGKRPDVA